MAGREPQRGISGIRRRGHDGERDGAVDPEAAQRRPRSRASSAAAVETGFRRSALLTNLVKALRV